jgi:prophage tail gpP-like protein
MPIAYLADDSDSQSVSITFRNGFKIERFDGYDFASDFLTPADSFSFHIGLDENGISDELKNALKLGAEIQLKVESNVLACGHIDDVEFSADRSGGTVVSIHGRDKLGQTLDTVADPTFKLPNGGTLAQLLKLQLGRFGWPDDESFETDNAANRDAKKGKRGIKIKTSSGKTKKGKTKKGGNKRLADFILHQTKPYNHESVFHFCSRVAQRHGLWIWASADGEKLIVSAPDFNQEPAFLLHRGRDGKGNILSGSVRFNLSEQPTMIIADSFAVGGGGEYGKGRNKAYIVNPVLGPIQSVEVADLLERHKGAVKNILNQAAFPYPIEDVPFRPMFLHDDESKTQEQLNAFVKREMSLMYRKSMTMRLTVEGHGQTVDDVFVAWTPDTVVDVDDEISGVFEQMYVLGAAYHKSRQGGTTTTLDLIRLNSIDLEAVSGE